MQLFGETTEKKKKASGEKVRAKKSLTAKDSVLAGKLLSRPRITEKSYALNSLNQYVLVVVKEATKKTVKQAVEEVYAVNVEKVRIVCLPAKRRLFGKQRGTKSAIKKAIVSVAKGQSIELFKSGM